MVKYANVVNSENGFGEYKTGEWVTFGTEYGDQDATAQSVVDADLNDWIGFQAEHGLILSADASIDGLVHDQRGDIYSGCSDSGEQYFYVAYEE